MIECWTNRSDHQHSSRQDHHHYEVKKLVDIEGVDPWDDLYYVTSYDDDSPELQLDRQDASRSHHPPPSPRWNDRLIVLLKSTCVIKSRRKFAIQKNWWCIYAMIDLWSSGQVQICLSDRTIYFLLASSRSPGYIIAGLCRPIHDKHFSRTNSTEEWRWILIYAINPPRDGVVVNKDMMYDR